MEIIEFDMLPYQIRHKIINDIEYQLDEEFKNMGFSKKPEDWQYSERIDCITKKTTYFRHNNKYFCAELTDLGYPFQYNRL